MTDPAVGLRKLTALREHALRNRFAHGYASIDFARIWAELPGGLSSLDAFQTAVARHLGES